MIWLITDLLTTPPCSRGANPAGRGFLGFLRRKLKSLPARPKLPEPDFCEPLLCKERESEREREKEREGGREAECVSV